MAQMLPDQKISMFKNNKYLKYIIYQFYVAGRLETEKWGTCYGILYPKWLMWQCKENDENSAMAESSKKTVYGIGWSVLFKIVLFCDTIYEIKRLEKSWRI